jgi:transcriptional regulator with XRE-family HTH domain
LVIDRPPVPQAPQPTHWSADRILLFRRHVRWTQQELAQALGISYETISRLERGIGSPSGLVARALDQLEARLEQERERAQR